MKLTQEMPRDRRMQPPSPSVSEVKVPVVLLVVFFTSGASALIDQIVWTRALYRIFGVTAPAASTVLVAFMAGLAIGSYLFGRLADRTGRLLALYAVMELAIAVIAPLTTWVFLCLQPVYVAMAAATGLDSPWLPLLRGLLCFVVLLPPTILMGGTLPVLARGYLRGRPGGVVASLYSINTWGAVFGCFIAGYILLGVVGESRSLLLAATGNVFAAVGAWTLSGRAAPGDAPAKRRPGRDRQDRPVPSLPASDHESLGAPAPRLIYVVSFINGLGALALEVLWGRTAGMFTDASVYAYTCVIGVFLIGIALGSRIVGIFADRVRSPIAWLGGLIVAMAFFVAVGLRCFSAAVDSAALGGATLMQHPGDQPNVAVWYPLRIILLAAIMIAPVTLLSGACFPLLARVAIRDKGHEGRQLGAVYSINTIGGILGALAAGFVLLPFLGDQGSFLIIAGLYLASGVICLNEQVKSTLVAAIGISGACLLLVLLPPNVSLSRSFVEKLGDVGRHVDTPSGTVTAMSLPDGEKHLLVNGLGMTILCTDTKLMAHIPLTLHPHPRNILVICFGMGTSFHSASIHPVEVTAVELQPAVPEMFSYFHPDADQVLAQPKNHVRIGDGRNFLLLSKDRYSVITIDPAPPMYSAGTVNLYSLEFVRLCRDHLDDDGINCLWIPNAQCLESEFKLILKTYYSVFPYCQIWMGPNMAGYYLIGSLKPLVALPDRIREVGGLPGFMADLSEYISELPPDYWPNMYRMRAMDTLAIDRYVADETRLLTDDRPFTEFPWLTWLRLGQALQDRWMNFAKLVPFLTAPDGPAPPAG